MKEIHIGEQVVRVRATPLALLYYRQEFKSDLLGDLTKFEQAVKDPTKLDTVVILQLIWAMAKADAGLGAQFPSFEVWLAQLDSFDVSDQEMLLAVIQEASNGFLSSRATGRPPKIIKR